MKIRWSWFFLPLVSLLVALAVVVAAATFEFGSSRRHQILAQRRNLLAAAAQYPNFTMAQRRAILREKMRELHPKWQDLTLAEIAQKLVKMAASSGSTSVAPIANFSGNLTVINAPAGDFIGLDRKSDCSLTLGFGTFNLTLPTFSYNIVDRTTDYDQVLHSEAGLTTTGAKWPNGCVDPIVGIAARNAAPTGFTTTGQDGGGAVGYDPTLQQQVVFTGAWSQQESTGSTLGITAISGSSPVNIAAADLNGDGNRDLVTINTPVTGTASVSVMLGSANGAFGSPTTYALPESQGIGLVIDDFNGDGKLDLIASSYTESVTSGNETFTWQLSFFPGNGDGTFQAAQNVTVTAPASITELSNAYGGLISADIRGNNTKDLVTAEGIVLLGNGNGTFSQVATPAFTVGPSASGYGASVVAADFNGDGKTDLAVDDGVSIALYLGNGAGAFTAGNEYATIANVGYLNATDLDGDGTIDLYSGIANGGTFLGDQFEMGQAYALMSQGNGNFSGAPELPFAYTGANLVPLKTSSAALSGVGLDAELNSYDVSVTSYALNSNGTFTTGPSSVLSPFTAGSVTYQFQGFTAFGFGDFNGDGKTDLIFLPNNLSASAGGPNIGLLMATGNGDGTFNTPVLVPLPDYVPGGAQDDGATISDLLVADVNGDGKPDLIYNYVDTAYSTNAQGATQYAGIAVQLGNGDGTFMAPQTIQTYSGTGGVTGEAPLPVYVGTAIAGGKLDIFAIQSTLGSGTLINKLVMYPGNGDGTFGTAATPPTADNLNLPTFGEALGQVALADMNGDGKPDLLTLGTTNNGEQSELAIALGNGDGTFQTPTILDFGGGGSVGFSLAVADFNGDGKLDVAVGGGNPPEDTGIFLGNGDGTVQSFTSGTVVEPAESFAFAGFGSALVTDINGDGKPDLILGSVVLINQGAALTATTTTLATSATSVAAGQNVTFTATVSAATTPTGSVTFLDGATTLATVTLNSSGAATYSTSALAVGAHSITAQYGGNSTFATSTSPATVVTVTAATLAPTTTTVTASPTSITSGASVTLTATVTPASGPGSPTGTVSFLNGTTTLGSGSISSGTATYSTTSLPVGADAITAQYSGDSNFAASTSTPVTVSVNAATPPSFTIGASPASGSVTAGQSVTTTITVTPAGGFNSQVGFACTGLPAGGTCAFSPTTVTPNGTAAAGTTLTIATASQSSALTWPARFGLGGTAALAAVGGGFLWIFGRRRKLGPWHQALSGLLLLIAAAAAVAGCGGSKGSTSGGGGGTQPQNYTVTVTATAGSQSQTATYTLTVN